MANEFQEGVMNTIKCSKCGKERLASSLNENGVCLVCAPTPSANNDSKGSNGGPLSSEGSSKAISVVDNINRINAFCGVVLSIVLLVMGFDLENYALVGLGFAIALITLVSWAVIKVFVGVAQDIRAIREKVESQ
jgi:hypothetical protein